MRRTAFALLLTCALGLPGTATAAPRPNIVIIIGDDLTWRDIGAYGSREVHTPNLDRLAGEGLRFTHAFQAAPMCSPTRSNLYTGLYPVRNGAYPNHAFVREGVRSIFHYLGDLGYRVALTGKQHVAPRSAFPYEYLGNDGGEGPNFERTEAFLRQAREQPFLLVVASNQPHSPWNRGKRDQYDPTRITLPPPFVDTPDTRAMLARYYAEITYLDDEVGRVLRMLDENDLAENTLVLFTSEHGSSFPGAKWTLYDRGIRTALIARWPGRLRPGSTTDAMVEYSDVVPTLVEIAGGKPAPGLDGRSFLPVMLGERDTHKEHVYGIQTTRGIFFGSGSYGIRSVRSRRFKYIRNLTPDSTFRNAVTHGRNENAFWKSWVAKAGSDPDAAEKVRRYQHRPAEELYDVLADPEERDNLADDPRYRAEKDTLRGLLEKWMREQGDRGQQTEMEALERMVRTGGAGH